MGQTAGVEMLRCWRGRSGERHVVLAIGVVALAFMLGAAALVQE